MAQLQTYAHKWSIFKFLFTPLYGLVFSHFFFFHILPFLCVFVFPFFFHFYNSSSLNVSYFFFPIFILCSNNMAFQPVFVMSFILIILMFPFFPFIFFLPSIRFLPPISLAIVSKFLFLFSHLLKEIPLFNF